MKYDNTSDYNHIITLVFENNHLHDFVHKYDNQVFHFTDTLSKHRFLFNKNRTFAVSECFHTNTRPFEMCSSKAVDGSSLGFAIVCRSSVLS